jgi:nicotinamidase-related amidase
VPKARQDDERPENECMNDTTCTLIDPDDSVLIIIDVQEGFLQRLPAVTAKTLLEHLHWLISTARWLEVPIVVTAEDLATDGPTEATLRAALPADVPDLDKVVFGLADQEDILARVVATGRRTAILTGMETDVCVQHSAFGLARRGFRVAAVVDATASPHGGHEVGLDRMRAAGIALVSTKSLFFEWMRTLARCQAFFTAHGLAVPDDLPWA